MEHQYPQIPIILASTSPRRQELLALADVAFSTLSVDIDESIQVNELPQDYIVRMISDKAKAACRVLIENTDVSSENNASLLTPSLTLVITADTIGVLPNGVSVLVKPQDKADAFAMWSKMSGVSHKVWTAVQLTLIDSSGHIVDKEVVLEKTEVTFIPLTPKMMASYWQSGEPQDKAGGYAIQGKGATWVERIHGSYTNVVGLPLSQTIDAIHKITSRASN